MTADNFSLEQERVDMVVKSKKARRRHWLVAMPLHVLQAVRLVAYMRTIALRNFLLV